MAGGQPVPRARAQTQQPRHSFRYRGSRRARPIPINHVRASESEGVLVDS